MKKTFLVSKEALLDILQADWEKTIMTREEVAKLGFDPNNAISVSRVPGYLTVETTGGHTLTYVVASKEQQLSPHQTLIVRQARLSGGKIVRVRGGFWVPEGTKLDDRGTPVHGVEWCDVRTIRALERKGALERTHEHFEEWRDSRQLVEEVTGR